MTREEAIKELYYGVWWSYLLSDKRLCDSPARDNLDKAIDMAISALRKQETVTERHQLNEPLTLDDLRKIYDGEEGAVWVKIGKSCWPAILDIYYGKLVAVWSALDFCHESNYGKTWLAYRQKPEEGTV